MNFIPKYNTIRPSYILPNRLVIGGVLVFIMALITLSMLYSGNVMPINLWLFGIGSVLMFFYGGRAFVKKEMYISPKAYKKQLITTALLIRVTFVLFINYFNWNHFGTYWGTGSTDVTWYVPEAWDAAEKALNGEWNFISQWRQYGIGIDDIGYTTYLTMVYIISGRISDIVLPLLLKALYGSIICWLLYKIAARHFGEGVGRMCGALAVVYPNMIWWCGSMMKEIEMVFVMIVFIDLVDASLSESKMPIGKLVFALCWGLLLLTFRTALGLVAYLAILTAVLLSSTRIVSWGKKTLFSLIVLAFLGVAVSDRFMEQLKGMQSDAQSGEKTEARYRSYAKGNTFAQYATKAVFAPMIFTIPFPSLVYTTESQEQNMQRSGGNYIKNIMSYFVILVAILLLLSGEWRRHVFPAAFLVGYLVVLVFSAFAHSGRFHFPAEPLELIFASYGISLLKNPKYKRWMIYMFIFEFIVCIGWNWVKLKGRGYV